MSQPKYVYTLEEFMKQENEKYDKTIDNIWILYKVKDCDCAKCCSCERDEILHLEKGKYKIFNELEWKLYQELKDVKIYNIE